VVGELFYLLGDFYLKNKETVKAVRFYLHDLCFTPDRVDSWAGMALARMSQIDAKLASVGFISCTKIIIFLSIKMQTCFEG